MIRINRLYLVLFVLSLLIGIYVYNKYRVAPGIVFPQLQLSSLDGTNVSFESYRGKKLLVCMGASWCGNCRVELKDLMKIKDEYLPDVEILVISDEPLPVIKQFKDSKSYPFTFLHLNTSFESIGVHSIPTSYILNKDLEVKKKTVGYLNWTDPSTAKHLYTLMD
mgnify:CR=1 FL=1